MPTLAENFFYTVTRLVGKKVKGGSVGTGFFYRANLRVFLITNKHVVKDVIAGEFRILLDKGGLPDHGNSIPIPFSEKNFIGHPDPEIDITVMNLSEILNKIEEDGKKPYIKNIRPEDEPSPEVLEKFVTAIEDVVFIGFPSGIWDSVNQLPVARKGITATPYEINFEGTKRFLIDASVFPGSSGSPVFIYHGGSYPDKEGNLYAGTRGHFLGILAKVFKRVDHGEIKAVDVPTAKIAVAEIEQMIDLGIVFKAEAVNETVDEYLRQVALSSEQGGADQPTAAVDLKSE